MKCWNKPAIENIYKYSNNYRSHYNKMEYESNRNEENIEKGWYWTVLFTVIIIGQLVNLCSEKLQITFQAKSKWSKCRKFLPYIHVESRTKNGAVSGTTTGVQFFLPWSIFAIVLMYMNAQWYYPSKSCCHRRSWKQNNFQTLAENIWK